MVWNTARRNQRLGTTHAQQHALIRLVHLRDAGRCHMCGRYGATEVDHIVPIFEGGANNPLNMAMIHATPCHQDKTRAETLRAHPTTTRPVPPHPGAR